MTTRERAESYIDLLDHLYEHMSQLWQGASIATKAAELGKLASMSDEMKVGNHSVMGTVQECTSLLMQQVSATCTGWNGSYLFTRKLLTEYLKQLDKQSDSRGPSA